MSKTKLSDEELLAARQEERRRKRYEDLISKLENLMEVRKTKIIEQFVLKTSLSEICKEDIYKVVNAVVNDPGRTIALERINTLQQLEAERSLKIHKFYFSSK